MAKKVKETEPATTLFGGAVETIVVDYDLFDLPTAQHKAGLAGLILQLKSMESRKKDAPRPVVEFDANFPSSRVRVTFTEESMKALFDDLYEAAYAEGAVREKPFTRGKGETKREVEPLKRAPFVKKNAKDEEKTVSGYVYLELTPSLATLRHYLPQKGEWVKLWRDLLWQIVREGKKKAPYIKRAKAAHPPAAVVIDEEAEADDGGDDDKASGDGSTWLDLQKVARERAKNSFAEGKLSGALFLGAMAQNAETLPLKGRIEHNLLLHFWPLTVMVYVPRFIDREGKSHIGRRDAKDKAIHFAVVVPEVADLPGFVEEYPRMLQGLGEQVAVFRPAECLVDLPAEGALSLIEHLARLTKEKAGAAGTRFNISSVEYFHLSKTGNNIKFQATGRVAPGDGLIGEYLKIVGTPGGKPPYANPLFRRMLMMALLDDQPWHVPFGKLLADFPHDFFIRCESSPKTMAWFWVDARHKFKEITDIMEAKASDDLDDLLADIIHGLVRQYIGERAKSKSGIDPDKFKVAGKIAWDTIPAKFGEEKRHIGESLFLEFRSRKEQAFVDHFAQTLFATKQFISEANYKVLAAALYHRPENVKTLTLMALSANS